MLTKTALDPDQVRRAEKLAEQNWGPDWRSKKLEAYFAEMIEDEPPPIPDKFDGAWFVVQAEPQQEKSIAAALIGNRFRFYLPMRTSKIRVNDRRHRTVSRPMLPGYLFASFDARLEQWKRINSIEGVIGVLSLDMEIGDDRVIEKWPVRVPLYVMNRLRDKEAELANGERVLRCAGNEELELGCVVRVLTGPFAMFFGRVVELSFKKERLKAEVDIFGRSTPVDLEAGQVEII